MGSFKLRVGEFRIQELGGGHEQVAATVRTGSIARRSDRKVLLSFWEVQASPKTLAPIRALNRTECQDGATTVEAYESLTLNIAAHCVPVFCRCGAKGVNLVFKFWSSKQQGHCAPLSLREQTKIAEALEVKVMVCDSISVVHINVQMG